MKRVYIKIMALQREEALGDVAKKIGVTQPTLSNIIAGAGVSPDIAKKIAKWHGAIDAATVLWGDDK